jgi:hypothetical protein
MKKTVYIVASLILFSACGGSSIEVKKQAATKNSAVAAGGQSEAELNESLKEIQKEEAQREKEELEKYTTLSFNEIEHDYGTVKEDSENTTNFIVTNTGNKPLIIEKVEASCGCTTPEKPEKPILPGKSDKIKVVFHPKPGQVGEQNKTVTVTANSSPRMTVLKIKAFVK